MRFWTRVILAAAIATLPLGAAPVPASADDAPLPNVLGPPDPPPPPAPPQPAPPPPIRGQCVAYVVTDLGPKTMICALDKPLPEGADCGCPWGPVPPGELPSPPAAGHVQGAG